MRGKKGGLNAGTLGKGGFFAPGKSGLSIKKKIVDGWCPGRNIGGQQKNSLKKT